ncbi:MAG: hypothetical protein R2822_02575 [Spirosomataceae bacterium]
MIQSLNLKPVFLQLPSIKETLVASTVNEPIDNTADVQSTAINEDLINKPRKSSRMAKV